MKKVLEHNPEGKRLFKKIIFFSPFMIISWFVFLKIEFNETYLNLLKEDGVVEFTQSFVYFLSSIFALLITVKFFRTKHNLYALLYLLLSIGLFFYMYGGNKLGTENIQNNYSRIFQRI